jgi:hypothetical protein
MALSATASAGLTAADPLFDRSEGVQMYGQLAAVLAGFAFAGLVLYLGREVNSPAGRRRRRATRGAPNQVTEGLFYAMASLVVIAFLYASLAGERQEALGKTLTAMLAYGIGFGLAVLSIFYAVTLMMLGHPQTSVAARRTIWVIVVVGPLVVMRFLAGVASDVWKRSCGPSCPDDVLLHPLMWGALAIVALFVVSVMLIWDPRKKWLRWLRFLRTFTIWILRFRFVNRVTRRLRKEPLVPVRVAFVVSALVGVASLGVSSLPSSWGDAPPMWVTYVALVAAVGVLAFFAVAAGSVLAPAPPRARNRRWVRNWWRRRRRRSDQGS